MPMLPMAEIVTSAGQRLQRRILRRGVNAVYVALGVLGANKPCGFFIDNGKPVPSNPYKNLRLTTCSYRGRAHEAE